MDKTNKESELKYKRSPALEILIDTIERHETTLNMQTENTFNSEDDAQELQEKTIETKESIIELAKNAKLLRDKLVKKNILIYFCAIVTLTLVITLAIFSFLKNFKHEITETAVKNKSKIKRINHHLLVEDQISSEYFKQDIQNSDSYEYDYCTDYPLDNQERARYYFLSGLMMFLSLLLLIISILVNKSYSQTLHMLINENFKIKYELCFYELKAVQMIQSIIED